MIEKFCIFMSIMALVIGLTNIITQVVKKITYDKIPTQVVVAIVSVVLCIAGILAWCAVTGTTVTWYIILGAFTSGLLAAYGAMFGYDNLYGELWKVVKRIWQLKKQTKD